MPRQERTSGSALTPKVWSKEFYKYALEENFFANSGLIGTGENACIQVKNDLKGATKVGDTVQFQMHAPLQGTGGGNDFSMKDNLEAYDTFYFDVPVAERGHATGVKGPMTQQRMIEDWPELATRQIASWKGRIMELELIAALSGLYNLATDLESVNELAPSSNRIYYGGENSAGVLSASKTTDALLSAETATDYLFGPSTIEEVLYRWLDTEPRPQPLMIDGRKVFLLLIDPLQGKSLVQNTRYRQHFRDGDVRGSKNTLMRDSYGIWNAGEYSVLIRGYNRIQRRTGAGGTAPQEGFVLNGDRTATTDAVANGKTVSRAILLGQNAGAIGYGGKEGKVFNRRNGDEDGGTNRKPFKGVDWIYGVSKTQFKSEDGVSQEDFATYIIETQSIKAA